MEQIKNDEVVHFAQKWAHANGLDAQDAKHVVENMQASDYMVFVEAVQQKDFDTIAQLYYRAKASMSESFDYFRGERLIESAINASKEMKRMMIVRDIDVAQLYEYYRALPGASYAIDQLSHAHLQSMVCEGFGQMQTARTMKPTSPTKPVNPASQMNGTQTANPQMALKQKQQQLQKPNPGMQVSIPQGTIGGELTDLEGIDIDPTNPENTQVVVKSPDNPNEIDVLSLDDVDLVQETDRISRLAGIDK